MSSIKIPIYESLEPIKLLSLILADPIKAILSSTIINLLWTYIISVTGILWILPWVLKVKNCIYSVKFYIKLKDFIIDFSPLQIVS